MIQRRLLVLVVLTVGACAPAASISGGSAAGAMSAALGLSPGDSLAYRRDLAIKTSTLDGYNADMASSGQKARNSFNRWTATGVVIGLAGGILGSVVEDKDDAAKAGAVGSALTGAITAWLGARKYETEAARAEKCRLARESAIRLFKSTWTPYSTPMTKEEVTAYETANAKAHETIRAGCTA